MAGPIRVSPETSFLTESKSLGGIKSKYAGRICAASVTVLPSCLELKSATTFLITTPMKVPGEVNPLETLFLSTNPFLVSTPNAEPNDLTLTMRMLRWVTACGWNKTAARPRVQRIFDANRLRIPRSDSIPLSSLRAQPPSDSRFRSIRSSPE